MGREMTSEAIYDTAYFESIRSGRALYEKFASILPIADYLNKRVLDVGCGRGDLLEYLIARGCRDVAGIDFARAAVEQARRRIGTPPPGVRVDLKQGSVTEQDLHPVQSVDLAFMTDIVEHLPPDTLHAGLENVKYWLKPQGRLVVHTFPTLGPHQVYRRILRMRGKADALARLDVIHCNVQTRSSLRDALERANFAVDRLWIANNLRLTSSAYQSLRPGPIKALLGKILEDVVGAAPVRAVLGEYAALSIYAVASPRRSDIQPM
jgi:cyclopropane fatty-acyl-phospholipid synthase-like methyltransferase